MGVPVAVLGQWLTAEEWREWRIYAARIEPFGGRHEDFRAWLIASHAGHRLKSPLKLDERFVSWSKRNQSRRRRPRPKMVAEVGKAFFMGCGLYRPPPKQESEDGRRDQA